MIYKLLLNFNNFLAYFVALFIICLLIYVIYKVFILENDLYILNDKVNKMEIEYCGGVSNDKPLKYNQDEHSKQLDMNEIIMNNIFNDNINNNSNITEMDIIDIDKIELKEDEPEITEATEPIFDLKKEVLTDDKESIISTTANTKKKLLKLNLDRLKDKCTEQGLSTDGTKAQLIERILEKEQSQ